MHRNRTCRLSFEALEARSLLAVDVFVPTDAFIDPSDPSVPTDSFVPPNVFSNGQEDGLIGLLLPAVQKVREAAARLSGSGATSFDLDLTFSGGRGGEALTIHFEDVLISSLHNASGEQILIGLLLPAVQQALDGAITDGTITDGTITDGTYLQYELKNVVITSYSVSGSSDLPAEQLSLPFGQIKSPLEALDLSFVDDDAEAYLSAR